MAPRATVLVVDDEPSIRLLCRVNLELEGYEVLEAASLAEARAQLRSHDVAAVLLDIHVGADNGLELLRELRDERAELPVALLTGTAEDPPAEARSTLTIAKPFTIDKLTAAVRGLVSS
jgi:two-component system, OmpR family, response regulator